MSEAKVKNSKMSGWRPTRRELLGAAAASFGLLCDPIRVGAQATQPAASRPSVPRLPHPPWWMKQPGARSRVVEVRSGKVLHTSVVDRIVLGEMLDRGMQALTGAVTVEDAWRTVLGSARRIVLKFNSVGARVINTNDVLARQLVEQLAAAGYPSEAIAIVETPPFLRTELGTRQVSRGWGAAIRVGNGLEPLAQYLYQADAIINVPFLKTHQIAGMSGCLKNLSHALIRHPARYHANGCSPYVGQVVGSQAVSSRIKLNLLNAMRVVVNNGPDAREEDVAGYGALVLGYDPLAIDTIGLSILAQERRRKNLPAGLAVPYLDSAAEMKLGRWRPGDIDQILVLAEN